MPPDTPAFPIDSWFPVALRSLAAFTSLTLAVFTTLTVAVTFLPLLFLALAPLVPVAFARLTVTTLPPFPLIAFSFFDFSRLRFLVLAFLSDDLPDPVPPVLGRPAMTTCSPSLKRPTVA